MKDVEFDVEEDEFAAFWRRVEAEDWEPASFGVLDRMLAPDSAFLDVGAWIGPLTLYAAHLALRCHAVEPDPRARAGLLANIACNPGLAGRIQVHPEAVGEASGPGRMGNVTSGAGASTFRAGSGRYRPSLSSLASSPSSRATPRSSTAAKVILSMPGAPLRTATHAHHRTSLRQILSAARGTVVQDRLAARYSACCKARIR